MQEKLHKRIGSALLALGVTMSFVPTTALASESSFKDIEGHWGERAIERWAGYGVVGGKGNGIFDPDANLTRAEMAQIYVNLLNLTEKADISKYIDVPTDAWYSDAISRCVAAGILTGTSSNTISPMDTVTREQMFVTLCRALEIEAETSTDAVFTDLDQVSDWAEGSINALLEAGYVGGTGNSQLKPLEKIDRASVVALLDKTIAGYGNKVGTTIALERDEGMVLVVSKNVTITGRVGDVIITQGAADGTVTFENAEVSGTVTVSAPGVRVRVINDSHIKEVSIDSSASETAVTVDQGSSVDTLTTEADKTTVSGKGTVSKVEAAEGSSDVTVNTTDTKVVNNSSETVTTGNGTVKPGDVATTTKPATGGSSSGGGSTVVTTASVKNYDQLKAALENENIRTITVTGDFQIPESLVIPQGKTVTLDLNGHHITVPAPVEDRSLYAINNYGALTIRDTSAGSAGSIRSRGVQNLSGGTLYMESGTINSIDSNGGGAAVWNEGTLFMTGGTLAFTGEKSGNSAGSPLNNRSGATATITGGQLLSPFTCMFSSGTLRVKDIALTSSTDYWMTVKVTDGDAVLENVTINTTNGGSLENAGGNVTLKNCNFIQEVTGDPAWNSVAVATSNGGNTVVESGTYSGSVAAAYIYKSGGTITIQSGTFTGTSNVALKADDSTKDWSSAIIVNGGNFIGGYNIGRAKASLSISAGTFTVDPSDYIAYSSQVVPGEGIWTVAPVAGEYEAKIGNTTYVTLADAVEAAMDGQTVDLLKSTTTNEQIIIKNGITLDGHGFTITAGTWDDTSASKGNAHLMSVSSGNKTVVIKNITLAGAKDIGEDNGSGLNVYESRDVTLNNVTLKGNAAAGLIVNGSIVNANGLHTVGNKWYGVNVARGDGVTTTPDFTFDAASTFDEDIAVCSSSDATISAPEGWVCVELSGGKVWGQVFASGTGTEQNPYQIANAKQLKLFRDSVNLGKNYQNEFIQLTADMDLGNEAWTPIGKVETPFEGIFDGGNHTVSNLSINEPAMENAGLFGVLKTPGMIKNLTVKNADVTAKASAGALIGTAHTGSLENCTVTGQINITANYKVGGLAGGGYADITNCHVDAAVASTVTGNYLGADLEGDNVGGLIGFMGEGDTTLSECSVSGLTVSGTRKVGGLVGSAFNNNLIENCAVSKVTVTSNATEDYAMGNLSSMGIGGLAGIFTANGNGDGHLTNCTVENITLTGLEDVQKGYLVGGMRGDLPSFPQTPWYQTGNKLLGTNSGSNSKVDKTVVNGMYPAVVSTIDQLSGILASGGYVQLGADIDTSEELIFMEDTILDINGRTLTVNNGGSAIKVDSGKTLTVTGSGTIHGSLYANSNAILVVRAGENFQVDSDSSMGWAVYGGTGATVDIIGGTYSAAQEGAVIYCNSMFSGELSIKDATVTVDSASVIDSIGISANTPQIYLEDVTVNANYSRAFYSNGSSHIVIRGGRFITDKTAGNFLNPTIQFSGTMDISDASITRVGYGIKKGYGSTLNVANLTFIKVGDDDSYTDTN